MHGRVIWLAVIFNAANVWAQDRPARPASFLKNFSTSAAASKQRCVLRTGNAVLAVQVLCANDTANNNPIYAGLFNIGTSNNRTLLFDFPRDRFTSHLNVWLDGRLFSTNPSASRVAALPVLQFPVFLADSTIACRYQIENLIIEQRLRPEQYSDSTGAIFMQYFLTNHDGRPHEVGLLLELDTKINEIDSAAILTQSGYSDREAAFRGASVPDFFQAFEFRPPQSGLVAQGTLAGLQATRPDFFAVGDWINLRQVKWDFIPGNERYNDSAVLLRWDPQPLAPAQTRILGTYYGVGNVTTAQGDLALSVSAPAELRVEADTLKPNPFTLNLLVTNTGLATANGVRAQLELPAFLSLVEGETAGKFLDRPDLSPNAAGAAAWRIRARCARRDTTLKIIVRAFAQNAPENFVETALRLPACGLSNFALSVMPERQTITAGASANYLVSVSPRGNFNAPVVLDLWPGIPGIHSVFQPQQPLPGTASQLTLQTVPGLLAGTYPFAVIGRSLGLTQSDTIFLHVNAAVSDHEAPRLARQNPAPGGRNVLPETAVRFEIEDEGAGVDSAALILAINHQRVRPRISGNDPRALVIEYQPAQAFRYNEEVQVEIHAADFAAPRNEIEASYSFFVVTDHASPYLTDLQPPPDATAAPAEAEISFHVRDDLAGVDTAAIAFWVDGKKAAPILQGSPLAVRARYKPPQAFMPGARVPVKISARDRAAPANAMTPVEYSFQIQPAIYDLIAVSLRPEGELRAGVPGKIRGEIRNGMAAIAQPFRVLLQMDQATIKDTVIAAFAREQASSLFAPVHFTAAGAHEIIMKVDADNSLAEFSEDNNQQRILLEILPAVRWPFTARPNPFTPNHDGYNDVVEFDYAGLDLQAASLKIFDVEGVNVQSWENSRAGLVAWDGRDRNGRPLPPGIYFYSLRERGHNVMNGYIVLAR